ncbi:MULTISPECIES: glycerate kinase [Lactiplantibacillus]|uniref:Glycerate kinase n=1 Tax=Lactiplantibacillus pentosus TaxID=1589 RepID=A0ABD7IKV2_LACPE|nr:MULTISPECIES: glycerate kinase [Lactiplantibacillus]MCC3163637.1 glycerate kinase [Lactiplantibacillus pentosus]MCJ8188658.1 glycerate kinase [Lactiplantibacillus pentosus]MCM8609063.1 glycerate kinase [Lactiplantibacillus sp. B652]PRO95444.1 glycerate kinase [Lactiplantibacillus pentosus]RMW42829.1 glycerate kinase [Lactiplantibacillus pentosus]
MHALIAIDSFKNSITSIQANQLVARRFEAHGLATTQVAIADGGEGTVAAWLANHAGGQSITAQTVDLAQQPLEATYGYFAAEKLAVIEVAAASGIQFVTEQLTPLATNTYGTGLLIKDAIKHGARKIILGLGGSGTVDGGAGILRALGYRFLDADGNELAMIGADLGKVATIETQQVLPQLADVTFISAADVTNPLTGTNGAARIFGPQKGLPAAQIDAHDAALAHYMTIASGQVSAHAGDGAAGGIGFALRYFLHAQVQSGFQLLADVSQLKAKVAQADLVISGEGQVDDQSFMGKVPIQLSQMAQAADKPCYLLVGRQKGTNATFAEQGVTAVLPIVDQVMTLDQAMAQGPANLERMADRLARIISRTAR